MKDTFNLELVLSSISLGGKFSLGARILFLLSSELPCGMKWENFQFRQYKSRERATFYTTKKGECKSALRRSKQA